MSRLSKKALDRLSHDLRHGDIPSPDQLRALEEYRDECFPFMVGVLKRLNDLPELHGVGIAVSARQKSVSAIIDKLRREKTQVFRINDLAGVRILLPGTRVDQDALAATICSRFEKARLVDRRTKPSDGYRALHVILAAGGQHAEVQIRTLLQDQWAQLFEAVADAWGRSIRYGQAPIEPTMTTGAATSRLNVVQELQQLSNTIHDYERLEVQRGDPAELAEHRENVDSVFASFAEVVPHERKPPLFQKPFPAGADALIVVAYERSKGFVLEFSPFRVDQSDEARAYRAEVQANHRDNPDVEVVLLMSSSRGTLQSTHPRYFLSAADIAKGHR